MKANKLPEPFKTEWVEALRSGKYKQCRIRLHNEYEGGHCCLGVAEIVLGARSRSAFLLRGDRFPEIIRDETGAVNILTNMNDSGKTFLEIADYIEANL